MTDPYSNKDTVLHEQWWRVCKEIDVWEHRLIDENDVVVFREFIDKLPFVLLEDKGKP